MASLKVLGSGLRVRVYDVWPTVGGWASGLEAEGLNPKALNV